MLKFVDYTNEDVLECHKSYKLSYEYWDKFRTDLLTRARKLTEAKIWLYTSQYDLYQSFPDVFDFEKIYKQSIKNKLTINLFIGVLSKEEPALDRLCLDYEVSVNKKHYLNNVIIYEFYYEIDSDNVYKTMSSIIEKDPYFDIVQHTKENKKEYFASVEQNIKEILDTNSPLGTMNIPAFNFFIRLTPLINIFQPINYKLLDPFCKLRTSKYLILNNGKEMYSFPGGIGLKHLQNQFKLGEPSYYQDLEEIFRSTWEANIARIFNHIGVKWKYEKETFGFKQNKEDNYVWGYTPDFVLPDFKTIIEVKGFWDKDSITSYTSAKEKYTEHNFIHIDKDIYYFLDKYYKNKIPNWFNTNVGITPFNIPIVGITLKERVPFVKKLKQGNTLIFKRDQYNPYDKNAIQVLNDEGHQIGFVAKEWASIFSEKLDIGLSYNVTVNKIAAKVIFATVKMINTENDVISKLLSRITKSES